MYMMLDVSATASKQLKIGYIYTGVPGFANAEHVFIQEYMNYHDDVYTFVFWNPLEGKEVYTVCREPDILTTLQLFIEIRAEMPYTHYISHVATDHTFPLQTSLEYIKQNATYFTALIEGKSTIENWFQWRSEHEQELANSLKRADFMRLKMYPLTTIARLLKPIHVLYTVSPRYAWLDQSILKDL